MRIPLAVRRIERHAQLSNRVSTLSQADIGEDPAPNVTGALSTSRSIRYSSEALLHRKRYAELKATQRRAMKHHQSPRPLTMHHVLRTPIQQYH